MDVLAVLVQTQTYLVSSQHTVLQSLQTYRLMSRRFLLLPWLLSHPAAVSLMAKTWVPARPSVPVTVYQSKTIVSHVPRIVHLNKSTKVD